MANTDASASTHPAVDLKHDFEDDDLKPSAVLDHLKAHDEQMRKGAGNWAMAKAMYMTSYWKYMEGMGSRGDANSSTQTFVDVEVNRMFPFVSTYLHSLYPKAQRAIVMPDSSGRGDSRKTQLLCNRWLATQKVHQRIMGGIRQGIIYPGCGAKLGYDAGRGRAEDRVWLRIIPWWEMILDFDVNDPDDERFRGHVYYKPRRQVQEEYNLPTLTGCRRDDYLDRENFSSGDKRSRVSQDSTHAKSDEDAFVRVLEICNLVDKIKDADNPDIEYQGRIEIYVLGQGGELSSKPVYMGPLPMSKFDRTAMPHIGPLIFNHEPEFPFRGIPHSQRLLPQMRELNSYRAFMAMATRKDSRQYVTRKGAITGDGLTKITEGVDGYIAEVREDYAGPLSDIITPIRQEGLNTNIDKYMSYVELDLQKSIAQSPQARGEITKATAFEVQTVQQYTESEFGMHAAIKDQWLADILQIFLRACIAAMQTTDGYAGAYKGQKTELASIGATVDKDPGNAEETHEQIKEAAIADETAGQEPFVGEEGQAPLGEHDVQENVKVIVTQDITLSDPITREMLTITVDDIDAEFEISFIEGGRTPMTDAAMQQNLVALMQPYMSLWDVVQKGGPAAVLARTYMQTVAERFDFPKDMFPDELSEQSRRTAEEDAVKKQEQEEKIDQEVGLPPQVMETLQQVVSLPPDQALQALAQIFEGSPEIEGILQQIASMPPDAQPAAIQEVVQGLLAGAQQAKQGAMAEAAPQPRPPEQPQTAVPEEPGAF